MDNDQIIDIPGVGHVAFPASMSDTEVTAAAARLHQDAVLASPPSRTSRTPGSTSPTSGAELPIAANAGRAGAVRAGEELATNPFIDTLIEKLTASPALARAFQAAGGVKGLLAGGPGWGVAGAVAGDSLAKNPTVQKVAESTVRGVVQGGGGALAKVAGSGVARAVTGPASTALSINGGPFNATPAGERPGEAAERSEQDIAARQFQADVNREAGHTVVSGNTTAEILASIAAYNRKR